MRPLPLFATLILFVVLLPSPAARAPPDKDWTVLVYMDADNDLEDVGIANFLEMATIGSTDEVNIVVQMDRTPGYAGSYEDWTTAKRFYITAGMTPVAGSAVADLGEANMADPATLAAFAEWGISMYPARYYFLVLWDHGNGWKGVVIDDYPVANDRLNATELHSALGTITATSGRRIDLLGNDACRMTLEIQYELADYVDYFVGSEKDEPRAGWPYGAFLRALTQDPAMTPSEVASALVDKYVEAYTANSLYSVALSAVNASGFRLLVPELNAFLAELTAQEPFYVEEVLAARDATEAYEESRQDYDLYHFVENVLTEAPNPRLERRASAFFESFAATVFYERHWDNPLPENGVHAAHAHGLSLYFPTIAGDSEYAKLALSEDCLWDEFLSSYGAGVRPSVRLNATALSEDANGDGRRDTLVLAYTPAGNGTVFVDVYREGAYAFSRAHPAATDRADEVWYPVALGGLYEVTVYLFASGRLQNLTTIADLVIEEAIRFTGRVTGPDGAPLSGAKVSLINPRTGQQVETTTSGGSYALVAVTPTWFREGETLLLRVESWDRRADVRFPAMLAADRTIVQDVQLDAASPVAWYAAIVALAVLAAVGVAVSLHYRRRLRRFREVP